MKCSMCFGDFPENEIHDSHDVPCYLFPGNRQARRRLADKFGRHWLCKDCHDKYEKTVSEVLVKEAIRFSKEYFKEEKEGDTNGTNT